MSERNKTLNCANQRNNIISLFLATYLFSLFRNANEKSNEKRNQKVMSNESHVKKRHLYTHQGEQRNFDGKRQTMTGYRTDVVGCPTERMSIQRIDQTAWKSRNKK